MWHHLLAPEGYIPHIKDHYLLFLMSVLLEFHLVLSDAKALWWSKNMAFAKLEKMSTVEIIWHQKKPFYVFSQNVWFTNTLSYNGSIAIFILINLKKCKNRQAQQCLATMFNPLNLVPSNACYLDGKLAMISNLEPTFNSQSTNKREHKYQSGNKERCTGIYFKDRWEFGEL